MFQVRNIEDFNNIKARSKVFDINLTDQLNNTLLHISTINDNIDLVRVLLNNNADYKIINANCICPLFYIKSKEMMMMLYLSILGPGIFTVFNNGHNIISYNSGILVKFIMV